MFSASGGLVYHLRAWRGRRGLWAPFHAEVRRWLADWQPGVGHLVLIGPSGGYALARPFLARFQRVTVLEPDVLARRILAVRFAGQRFDWRDGLGLATPGGLARLAADHADAAFLFCNLLGQQPEGAAAGFSRRAWLEQLEPALAGRAWASWHDLASTDRAPDRPAPLALDRAEDLDRLLNRFWQGGELAIVDHDCAGLAPTLPRQYALWTLRPGRHHLVEWLASPAAAGPG